MLKPDFSRFAGLVLPVLALVATQSTIACAQATRTFPSFTTYTLLVENDVPMSDEQYTSGVQFSWHTLRPAEFSFSQRAPIWIELLDRLPISFDHIFSPCPLNGQAEKHCWNWTSGSSIGQDFYTPRDLSRTSQVRNDRPYAGWLYVGSSIQWTQTGSRVRQHTAELEIGAVGPASLADRSQRALHRVIKGAKPGGWRFQVRRTPGFVFRYQYRERLFKPVQIIREKVMIDFSVSGGATTGNIFNHGEIGGGVRLGSNLPHGFAGPSTGSGFFEPDSMSPPEAVNTNTRGNFVFLRTQRRFILSNYLIDGCQRCDLNSRPVVVDVSIGASIRIDRFGLVGQHVSRSPEFRPGGRRHSYNSVGISYFPKSDS